MSGVEIVTLRLPLGLKGRLREAARERSLNAEIVARLERSLEGALAEPGSAGRTQGSEIGSPVGAEGSPEVTSRQVSEALLPGSASALGERDDVAPVSGVGRAHSRSPSAPVDEIAASLGLHRASDLAGKYKPDPRGKK